MLRIRSARAIAEYFKSLDPGTMMSETLIRRLMDAGEVPIYKNGCKTLSSIEAFEAWQEAHFGGKDEQKA